MIDPNNPNHQLWMHGYYAGRIDERKRHDTAAAQAPAAAERRRQWWLIGPLSAEWLSTWPTWRP